MPRSPNRPPTVLGSNPTPLSRTDTSMASPCAWTPTLMGRVRMTDAVGQRFLDDAIDAGAMLVAQRFERARHRQFDRYVGPAREVTRQPFERGLEAEVVEHARPQAERQVADGVDHVVHELPAFTDCRARARGSGRRDSVRCRPSSIRSAVSVWPT